MRLFKTGPTQPPEGVPENRYHYRFDSVHEVLACWPGGIFYVEPGQDRDNQECRQNEAQSCDDQPWPTTTPVAQMNGHLGRVGPGNEIRQADQSKELVMIQPLAPLHAFLLH